MTNLHDSRALRDEVAAVAARLIAEDGLDYASAKQRALREVVGPDVRGQRDCLPDNATIEDAVREHQALFMADTQPERLLRLRHVARDAMRFLADAKPHLAPHAVGAVVNGTAGEHSDVHLVVHDDNAKDLEIFLVNAGVDFDAIEVPGGETLSFLWPPRAAAVSPSRETASEREAIHLTIVDPRAQRAAAASGAHADLAGLEALIDASATSLAAEGTR